MDANAFSELNIESFAPLDAVTDKEECMLCNRKRKYFCYACRRYVNGLEKVMPVVKLPLKIDIIKHKQELDSKSTAVHAALLAPQDCQILSFPDVPTYNPDTDVVVFPSDDSMSVEQWAELSAGRKQEVRSVVFIDCTWNQIHPIINCPQLANLPRIALHRYDTKFWRPNGAKRDSSCLATIEALYYFLKEYQTLYRQQTYEGEYDNLLIIFKYMYMKIKDFHNGGHDLKAYKKV